jgi:predicted glycosyltransferase
VSDNESIGDEEKRSREGRLRFLLYSHDGLGLGHVRRNLAIASALIRVAPDSSVLLVTGAGDIDRLGLDPGIDVLRLPALRKLANGRYAARRLALSRSDLTALRAGQIGAAVESFRPDVMLVDKHPGGARGELRPGLRALRAAGGRAVIGFRDILDDQLHVRREWHSARTPELIASHYDQVLVYGRRQVFDFEDAYGRWPDAGRRVRYTGYVVHRTPCHDAAVESVSPFLVAPRTHRPVVVATAGGGEDGDRLLETFIHAADSSWQGVVVAGPDMAPDRRHALRRAAVESGVGFRVFAHDLASWLGEADAVVCMGGYNTLAEALFRGTPTVCVPRVSPRTEQLIRALAFERLGLLRVVQPTALDAVALRGAVTQALERSRPELVARAHAALDFNGDSRAAGWLAELADRVRGATPRSLAERSATPVGAE